MQSHKYAYQYLLRMQNIRRLCAAHMRLCFCVNVCGKYTLVSMQSEADFDAIIPLKSGTAYNIKHIQQYTYYTYIFNISTRLMGRVYATQADVHIELGGQLQSRATVKPYHNSSIGAHIHIHIAVANSAHEPPRCCRCARVFHIRKSFQHSCEQVPLLGCANNVLCLPIMPMTTRFL